MAEYLTALGILTSVYIADYSKKKKEKTTNNKLYKDERSPLGYTKSVKDIVKMITYLNLTIMTQLYTHVECLNHKKIVFYLQYLIP